MFHFLHVCVCVCGGVRNKTIEELLSSPHKFNRYKKVMYQEERKPLKVTFIVSFGVEVHDLVIWFCYSLGKCWRFLKAHDIIIFEVHVGKANDENVIYVKSKDNTIAKWSNVHYKNSWHYKLSNLVILFVFIMNLINIIRSPSCWNDMFFFTSSFDYMTFLMIKLVDVRFIQIWPKKWHVIKWTCYELGLIIKTKAKDRKWVEKTS